MTEIPVREFRRILRWFEKEVGIQNQSSCCCDVSITQCHMLMELDKEDNITLNELASRLNLDKSTVSRTVDALVKKNLINRSIPEKNRRTILITLTVQGQKTCERINSGNDQYYSKVLGLIPREVQVDFLEGFQVLVQAMSALHKKH